MDILQIILGVNILLIGVLLTVAIQHALAHFRPTQPTPKRPNQTVVHISPEARQHLLETAQANFQHVLDQSADDLQHDLTSTATQLSKLLDKLGTDIVEHEVARYRSELDEVRKHLETIGGASEKEVAEQRAQLAQKLAEDIEAEKRDAVQAIMAEKQQLLQQIDTKLADAVTSFLVETLQHNVDLGAQMTYLTSVLEEHKDELKEGLKS
jgi:F0F1-type ATP synthase membrane subunit b/b'